MAPETVSTYSRDCKCMCPLSIYTDKEHWEPTIDRLFRLQAATTGQPVIREVWAPDWQTHGDSAVLNAALFAEPFSRACACCHCPTPPAAFEHPLTADTPQPSQISPQASQALSTHTSRVIGSFAWVTPAAH